MKCNNESQEEYKKVCCSKCKSQRAIRRGFRQTENRGKIQRFSCRDCGLRFVQDNGFFRMRNNDKKITLCLDLFFNGISLRKVQSHLQSFYPHNSSHMTIYRWIVKYSKMISKFTDNLNLKVGNYVEMDEMEFSTKGKKTWFIDCVDHKTRYLIASEFEKKRSSNNIRDVLKEAKQKTGEQIKIIATDGFFAYKKPIKKVFGYNNLIHKFNVEHRVRTALRGEGFNHRIERFHNSVRERTKIFRGFGSLGGANALMKGYEIYYNFIRKHQALGKCPYEIATDLKLNPENKWLQLINISKQNN